MAYRVHPRYPLIVAANRDEFFARPTATASLWDDPPGVVAGRDLAGGGTWLGIGAGGKFAALTNYRDPSRLRAEAPSRGKLVSSFLAEEVTADELLAHLRRNGGRYNGFNLVFGTVGALGCYSNVDGRYRPLEPGVHGFSNHLLDTPWPKVVRGRRGMAGLLELEGDELVEGLLALLADPTVPPDSDLPDTGVGLVIERGLSPLFIRLPGYGTRSSTVALVDGRGKVTFVEKTYDEQGREVHVSRHG